MKPWFSTFSRGSPTPNTPIPDACAMPSFAADGLIRYKSLTARPMGAGCAAVPETTTPGTPAPPTATTTRPATGTTTGSVSPARLHAPEPPFPRERRVCPKVPRAVMMSAGRRPCLAGASRDRGGLLPEGESWSSSSASCESCWPHRLRTGQCSVRRPTQDKGLNPACRHVSCGFAPARSPFGNLRLRPDRAYARA